MAEASIQNVIAQFQTAVSSGQNWYLALLAAARDWPAAEEELNGARYRYLISGEALDLNQVAERLIEASRELIPGEEQLDLLFRGKPPVALSPEEMKKHLGEEKYRQYLNYFYGVTVEETLLEVAEEEVRKEERGVRARSDAWITAEAFTRIYGKTQPELLKRFRADRGYAESEETSLAEMKEFTYWLFRYRLAHSDPEKSASDTKKALGWLKKHAK